MRGEKRSSPSVEIGVNKMEFLRHFISTLKEWSGYPDTIAGKYCPFQSEPYDFLEFAVQDLQSGSPQAPGNSLSNTKKAMDLQLDCFLIDYGLEKPAQKWPTAKKIEIIGDLGIVPPGILRRINDARNDFEHRYEMPFQMTAENAIEIVDLFIGATDAFLNPVREGTVYSRQDSEMKETLRLYMDRFKGTIGASHTLGDIKIGSIGIRSTDPLEVYLCLLSLLIHPHRLESRNPEKFFRNLKYIKPFLGSSDHSKN